MDADTAYIQQLKSILACDQGDGYLKKWAADRLTEIGYLDKQPEKPEKTPVLVG